jgi:hypothetical protein
MGLKGRSCVPPLWNACPEPHLCEAQCGEGSRRAQEPTLRPKAGSRHQVAPSPDQALPVALPVAFPYITHTLPMDSASKVHRLKGSGTPGVSASSGTGDRASRFFETLPATPDCVRDVN